MPRQLTAVSSDLAAWDPLAGPSQPQGRTQQQQQQQQHTGHITPAEEDPNALVQARAGASMCARAGFGVHMGQGTKPRSQGWLPGVRGRGRYVQCSMQHAICA